jgi:hypothetical protein
VRDRDLVSVFCRQKSSFLVPFVEKAVSSPTHILGTFVENQMAVVAWDCVRVFYCIALVFMTVFVPVPCTNFY